MKCDEPIYDLSILAKENYHIHTNLSRCAKPEMTGSNIISIAESSNLDTIALVDHHHSREHDILQDLARLKAELGECNTGVKVLVGAELSAYGIGKYSDSIETNSMLDYRLYACNHYHLQFWEHPEECSPRAYAEHSLAVVTGLIKSGRADCVAHPFTCFKLKDMLDDYTLVTKAISDNELADVLELGKNMGVSWEVNKCAVFDDPEFAKRYWRIGREVGATFRMGTDAHKLADIDPGQYMDRIQEILG